MDAYEYVVPPVHEYRRIPLHLFQTWQTQQLPPHMARCVRELISSNPEFKYQFYDDERCRSFIQSHFPEDVLRAYDTFIPGAYKADLWRYCILYIYGGIYLDIKYHCVPPFKLIELTTREHYVRDREFCGIDGIYQGFLSCYPRNPILYRCIRKIVEYVDRMEYGKTCLFVGPQLVGSHFCNLELKQMDMSYTGLGIQRGNKLIMKMYPEYRAELKQFASKKHYTELWMDRDMYHLTRLTPYHVDNLSEQRVFQNHVGWSSHPIQTTKGMYLQWNMEGKSTIHTFNHTVLPDLNGVERIRVQGDQYIGVKNTSQQYKLCGGTGPPKMFALPYSESICMVTYKEEPCVVYEWYPLQLCKLQNDQLVMFMTLYTTPEWFRDLKASNSMTWKGHQWVVLTRTYVYKKRGMMYMKTYHMFLMLDDEFRVKYSEFFRIGDVSVVSCVYLTEEGVDIGYTESGKCYRSRYTWEVVDGLRWNHDVE
jgi:hypothetical protein